MNRQTRRRFLSTLSLAAVGAATFPLIQAEDISLAKAMALLTDDDIRNPENLKLWKEAIWRYESDNGTELVRDGEGKDVSRGRAHLTLDVARTLKEIYPGLPTLPEDNEQALQALTEERFQGPYYTAQFKDLGRRYQHDPLLIAAAHNSGPVTPRNARHQQRLNHVLGPDRDITCDGYLSGDESRGSVREFQTRYNRRNSDNIDKLVVDGILGESTALKLIRAWRKTAKKVEYRKFFSYGNQPGVADASLVRILQNYPHHRWDAPGLIPRNGSTPGYVTKVIHQYLGLKAAQSKSQR